MHAQAGRAARTFRTTHDDHVQALPDLAKHQRLQERPLQLPMARGILTFCAQLTDEADRSKWLDALHRR